jgi:hypothetical protein
VTLYDGVRQQMEKGASGAPPRLTVLSFSENSVDLARVARSEETRSRDSRERSIAELLDPDPAEGLRPRDLRRFRAEAHQRMASPLTALSFALVGAWPYHQQCGGPARWADLADLAACDPAWRDFRLVACRRPRLAAEGAPA